jgi:hypothetical protein
MLKILVSRPEGQVLIALVIVMAVLAAAMVLMIETTMYEGDDEFVD